MSARSPATKPWARPGNLPARAALIDAMRMASARDNPARRIRFSTPRCMWSALPASRSVPARTTRPSPVEIYRLVGQQVAAQGGASRGGGVGDQEAAADGLGADRGLQEGRAQVDAVDDEAGHQAVFGQLFPDVVGVAAEEGMRAVAEVGGKGGSGGHGGGDLGGGCLGVTDGGDYAFGGDALDVAGRVGPFGGESDDANKSGGGVLPAVELVEVGRTDPLAGMGSAGPILGGDVGALDVEAVDCVATGDVFPGGGEIAQAGQHLLGRTGDHRRVKAGDSGGELGLQGAGDLFMGGSRVIVIDSGEAVDLEVDEAGGKVESPGIGGLCGGSDSPDHILERQIDREAGDSARGGTYQRVHGLSTSLAHRERRKCKLPRGDIAVQNRAILVAPDARARYKRRVH